MWVASTAAEVVVTSVAMVCGGVRWHLGCMGEGREYGGKNKRARLLGPARSGDTKAH